MRELSRHTEKLFYFYEIANAGSLHACARKLGLSAPTLSYTIRQLEQVTGVQLFERGKTGMRVTEAGERLLIFCRKYFRELEEVEQLLLNPQDEPLTHVRVGTFQSIAIYLWPHLLESLKHYPTLSVSIMTNRSRVVLEALMKREIDLAVTVEAKGQAGMIRHELYRDEYAVYASNKFRQSKLKQQDMQNMVLMSIPDAVDENGLSLRQHVQSWDLHFREEFELDSFEVIAEFVKRGYGMGILPTKVAQTYGSKIKPLRLEGMRRTKFGPHRFFLSYRDDLDMPQSLMDLFLNSARTSVRQISK